mgnify:CR=1 FL=1
MLFALEISDELKEEIIEGKRMKRREWDDVVDNIEELLDD